MHFFDPSNLISVFCHPVKRCAAIQPLKVCNNPQKAKDRKMSAGLRRLDPNCMHCEPHSNFFHSPNRACCMGLSRNIHVVPRISEGWPQPSRLRRVCGEFLVPWAPPGLPGPRQDHMGMHPSWYKASVRGLALG